MKFKRFNEKVRRGWQRTKDFFKRNKTKIVFSGVVLTTPFVISCNDAVTGKADTKADAEVTQCELPKCNCPPQNDLFVPETVPETLQEAEQKETCNEPAPKDETNLKKALCDHAFEVVPFIAISDGFSGKVYKESQFIMDDGNMVIYKIIFSGEVANSDADFGLPICSIGNTASPECDNAQKTEQHTVHIYFLGQEWYIITMAPPDAPIEKEHATIEGGRIELAKDNVAGVIKKGDKLESGCYGFELSDVSVADNNAAVIKVVDLNGGEVITKVKVPEDSIVGITTPNSTYFIRNAKATYGLTDEATWADISILFNKVELINGAPITDLWSTYPGAIATLTWTNKGAGPSDTNADHLKEITLTAEKCAKTPVE